MHGNTKLKSNSVFSDKISKFGCIVCIFPVLDEFCDCCTQLVSAAYSSVGPKLLLLTVGHDGKLCASKVPAGFPRVKRVAISVVDQVAKFRHGVPTASS